MKRRAQSKWVILISTAALFCLLVLIIKLFTTGPLPIVSVAPDETDDNTASSTGISFELITDATSSSFAETSDSRLVLFSSPLVVFDRAVATPFRPEEVIEETNRMRAEAGLAPLAYDPLLAEAAAAKVVDMFEGQYFDHVTPQGMGPDSFVKAAGYAYISVGENLALGNFGDEGGLVSAWMESQGHRDNILRSQFTEIGVAVGRGTFNGQRITIAVQHFGKPSTDCPSVRNDLKNRITTLRGGLTPKSEVLDDMRKDIEESSEDDNQEALIAEYNTAVDGYNRDVAEIKTATDAYNKSVKSFNTCLQNQ